MSPSLMIEWIKDSKLLDSESLAQLRVLLSTYPCFTTARVLYLKNLSNQNDLRFSGELHRTAVSVPDRRRLYNFMEDKLPIIEENQQNKKPIETGAFSIIDHYLHQSSNFPDTVNSETGLEDKSVSDKKVGIPAKSGKIDQVVSTDTFRSDGFALDYLSYLSIYPKTENSESSSFSQTRNDIDSKTKPMKGQDLIDAFLSNPSIEKQLTEVNGKDFNDSVEDGLSPEPDRNDFTEDNVDFIFPEATFTESLAKIYIKQKRYDRALEIIKSLSLKYPEKNVYFADQIRFLERLIINTKKR